MTAVEPAGTAAMEAAADGAGWAEYVAATAELDSIRRGAAAAVGEQERAAEAYRAQLQGVRARIALQRTRLAEAARRAGRPVRTVEPGPAEQAAARALMPASTGGDMVGAIGAAVIDARACLDAADAAITGASARPSVRGPLARWPAPARHALPYAWYALLATVVVVAVATVFHDPIDWWIRLFFALVAPTVAFVLGLATIVLVYPDSGVATRPRSIRLGLLICVIPLLAGLAFTAVSH